MDNLPYHVDSCNYVGYNKLEVDTKLAKYGTAALRRLLNEKDQEGRDAEGLPETEGQAAQESQRDHVLHETPQ